VAAGIKYLVYSVFGASTALLGIFFLAHYGTTLTFTPGGVLDMARVAGHEGLLRAIAFAMILGFGVKAGMFPMHAWLPTAHPVAPAPASAVLSGVITKMGVLGVIRVIFYLMGVDFLKGT
jgi:multicomponent Na+:H+ antiporter subunit D